MRNRLYRWLGLLVVAGMAVAVALHLVNAFRLDAVDLARNVNVVVERMEDASRSALPEYQDLAIGRLPSSPVNGEIYRFDDNLQLARVIDRSSGAGSDEVSEFVFQLEFSDDREIQLVPANGLSTVERGEDSLIVKQGGEDYLVNAQPIKVPLAEVSEFMLRARADKGNRFMLLWAAEGAEQAISRNRLSLDLIADGEFHTYIVNVQDAFRRGVDIGENISLLGLAPSNVDGATVEIEFIRVVSKLWKYRLEKRGTSYESVDRELRPVLFTMTDQALEYEVKVPARQPTMRFGTAALLSPAVVASVSVSAGEISERIFETPDATTDAWREHELDMSRWAGQSVRVTLEVQGSGEDNVVFWSNPVLQGTPTRPFNVIVLLEDTLRADHLSSQGYSRETAPEKEKLMAESGVIFTNAHSQATKTRPSIASLMTSLYPTATGVWNFSDRLSDRYLTLAELMRAQGFETAAFMQNGNAGPYAGAHQGFGSLRDDASIGRTTEDMFGEHLFSWLEDNRGRNFFLYLHAIDPHGVYDPPPPYDRWYREASRETVVGTRRLRTADSLDPDWAETPSAEARRMLYDGEIRHNDAVIGRFIRELDDRGFLDDTLLIFVSDHGEWMGERGLWEHHPPGNRPVIHVPLMVVYPKLFPEPARIHEAVQLLDVMPTVLELAEVDTEGLLMHGDSLVSLIQDRDRDHWKNRVTVSEEPMAMDRKDPCVCGSLFFDGWQLHGTIRGWPHPIASEFVKTGVYRYAEDGVVPVFSFLPDLTSRIVRIRALSRIQAANMELWRRITEGEKGDIYRMDPDTLEELRGLGYVN